MPRRITADELPDVLPPGGRTLVQGAMGESPLLAEAVMAAGPALGAMTFTGAIIPGTNPYSYLANADCRAEIFFMTPPFKSAPAEQVDFRPLSYNGIRAHLLSTPIDAALFMVTPPDADGWCSFGPAVDFTAELWSQIPVRIAHINASMPRTRGHRGIPFSELTAYVEADQGFDAAPDTTEDHTASAIAAHIAPYVGDGATLQTGIGKVPGAVLRALTGRRNLRIHSGLIVDEVVDLLEAGALADGVPVVAGCAIGSARLYAAITRPQFSFQPVSVTHNLALIAAIPDFIAINSALEVDLLGQVYAEVGPRGLMSGPGGSPDYARAAALSPGGLRIIALPASAARGSISRIVAPGDASGPVSLGRFDVDLIVTEHGVADLRDKGYAARAAALVAIAAPDHRETLSAQWYDYARAL